ncbi:MAG: ankyrin repeat domain-containing protein [Sodalis sp. (in: enterobacteria)]|uniref:ankyrin repeat domain-containing protein n=1 Tax=Sodalis sp. (in: enterobacteria) TaxID=1898979 RepID=UPI003F35DFB2
MKPQHETPASPRNGAPALHEAQRQTIFTLLLQHHRLDPQDDAVLSLRHRVNLVVMYALELNHAKVAHALRRQSRLDVNLRDLTGNTALAIAARRGRTGMLPALLRTPGIEVNNGNNEGLTPLMMAEIRHDHEAVRLLLLAAPTIDVNRMNYTGASVLLWATNEDHPAILQTLLQAKGIKVNLSDLNLHTPLIQAAQHGRRGMVRLLLAAPGIAINFANQQGITALMIAAENGEASIVRTIASAPGCNIDAPRHDGDSALLLAVRNNHRRCVEALLKAPGIDTITSAIIWDLMPCRLNGATSPSAC